MTPDPLTLDNINWAAIQGYGCGCRRGRQVGDTDWRLCEYHEGFDDGIEAARKRGWVEP